MDERIKTLAKNLMSYTKKIKAEEKINIQYNRKTTENIILD